MKNAFFYVDTVMHEMESGNKTQTQNKNMQVPFSIMVKYFILKKWIYIFCCCLAIALSSSVFAVDLKVSGLTYPTAANGIYSPNGTVNGKNCWKHTSENYYIYYSSWNDRWDIDDDQDDFAFIFQSTTYVSSPELATGWVSGLGSGTGEVKVEISLPTVTLTSLAGNPTNTSPIPITITFSESVTGFVVGDITVTNGTAGSFSGSGTTYTANITPSGQGTVRVDVAGSVATDAAGNGNTAATQLSRTFDSQAPTVSITSSAGNSTNSSPIPVTITFSESVTGFVVGDITVTNGTAGSFSGSGTTYTANITPSGQGTVSVDVAGSVATDAAGNGNTAATQLSRTYDNQAPTVSSISSPANANYTTDQELNFIINFNEAVIVSTGGGTPYLNITIGGSTVHASYISGSNSSAIVFKYIINSGDADGDGITVGANIINNGGTLKDVADNNASLTFSGFSLAGVLVNNVAPTVTTQAVSGVNITTATGNGNITSLGVPNPTQYGVVWSTNTGPTISLSTKTTEGARSTTGAFTSNITGLTGHTLYYVKAYATNSAGTSYGTEVSFTTDPAQTTISGGGNWSTAVKDNGNPGSSSNVAIGTGTISVDASYTVHDVDLSSDGALSVGPGSSLTITGNLTLTSDGTNTSSLIINGGTLNFTGTTTVKRYMSGNKWYIISPTASGQSVHDFLTANNNIPTNSSSHRGMMEYNTSANSWYEYYTTGTGNMEAGKGYAARITANGYINFVGTLTTGNKSVTVTCSGDNGWNCIGNPYTSAIHVNANANTSNNFITVNQDLLDPSYAAVYVWDESVGYDGSQNFYEVISNAGFSIPKTQLGQDRIQMGQGFFVKVKSSTSSLMFKPEMQVHESSLPLKTAKISWPAVGLTVKTDSLNTSTYIAYNERMTTGLDPTYDAGLIRGTTKLAVYSHLVKDNGIDFAIQCLPDKQIKNTVVPIGIDYAKGGEIKISVQSVEMPSGMNIILEDKLNKSFTTLSDGVEYKATVDPNTKGIGRFYLHTTGLTNYELKTAITTGKLNAYANTNKEIRIIGDVSSDAIATLYDLQGKVLWIVNLKESNLNVIPASNIKTGIYMLSVRDNNKSQAFKLFIKN